MNNKKALSSRVVSFTALSATVLAIFGVLLSEAPASLAVKGTETTYTLTLSGAINPFVAYDDNINQTFTAKTPSGTELNFVGDSISKTSGAFATFASGGEIENISSIGSITSFSVTTTSACALTLNYGLDSSEGEKSVDLALTASALTQTHTFDESFLPNFVSLVYKGTSIVTIASISISYKCVRSVATEETWSYQAQNDGTYYVSGHKAGTHSSATVPGTYNGKNVTGISQGAFWGSDNTYLVTATISENVKTLQTEAFNSCEALTTVSLPKSLADLQGKPFTGCTSLTNLSYAGTKAQFGSVTKDSTWKDDTAITQVTCSDGVLTL